MKVLLLSRLFLRHLAAKHKVPFIFLLQFAKNST